MIVQGGDLGSRDDFDRTAVFQGTQAQIQLGGIWWLYVKWSYVTMQGELQKERILDRQYAFDDEISKKSISMWSTGIDVPLFGNFHIMAEIMSFEDYVSTSYGVVLAF